MPIGIYKHKPHSKETKDKIRKAHLGKPLSEKHKRKISDSNMGKTISDETKRKIVETRRNNDSYRCTKETRKKISQSKIGCITWNKGIKCGSRSEETKLKISKSMRKLFEEGKLEPYNKNTNLSGMKGRHHTDKAKKKLSMYCGERSSAWRGGVSFEPYGLKFSKKLKEQIRKKDNQICQECGKIQEELNYLLHVHHVDYNKKNNSIFNLISLCRKCHIKTNHNRKHWEGHFKMKIFIKKLFNPENIKVFNENKQLINVLKCK